MVGMNVGAAVVGSCVGAIVVGNLVGFIVVGSCEGVIVGLQEIVGWKDGYISCTIFTVDAPTSPLVAPVAAASTLSLPTLLCRVESNTPLAALLLKVDFIWDNPSA